MRHSLKRRPLARIQPRRTLPTLELLEARHCLSAYTFDIVGMESSGNSLGSLPSINDSGTVAYTRFTSTEKAIMVAPVGGPARDIAPVSTNAALQISPAVQINNSGLVVNWNRRAGFARNIDVYDSNATDSFTRVAHAVLTGGQPLVQVFQYSSISNNDGWVTFARQTTTDGPIGVFRGNTNQPTNSFEPVTPFLGPPQGTLRPMVADGGAIVDRHGANSTDPIRLFRPALPDITIATSADFSSLGAAPGISDDGSNVAYYGDLTAGTLTGPGIFLFRVADLQQVRVAGSNTGGDGILEPWETYDDLNANGEFDPESETDASLFSSFSADTRVAVDGAISGGYGVTVVFLGFDDSNTKGLYAVQVRKDPSEPTGYKVSPPNLVAAVGTELPGFGTALDFSIYDPVNATGAIAFWTTNGSTQALVRAWPMPEVVNIVTHGLGNAFTADLGPFGSVPITPIPGFLDPWRELGMHLEQVPRPGTLLDGKVRSHVANWNSSDGWVPAAASFLASVYFASQGFPAAAQVFLDNVSTQMHRARLLAEEAATGIINNVINQGLLPVAPDATENTKIHLVGHSRGGAVNARVANLLTVRGFTIDQYTALDVYSTDWPHGSNLLADIDIATEVNASDTDRTVNYRVEDGLAEVIFDAVQPFLTAAGSLLFGPGFGVLSDIVRDVIRGALPDWKAPIRPDFENIDLVGYVTPTVNEPRSNHLNVVLLYNGSDDPSLPPAMNYILDNYVGQHRMDPATAPVGALMPLPSHALAPHAGAGAPSGPSEFGTFYDGTFDVLAQMQANAQQAEFPSTSDEALTLMIRLVTDPSLLITAQWTVRGDVNLVAVEENPQLELTQTAETSVGQRLILDPTARTIDFDLSVLQAESGDSLDVLFENQVLDAILLPSSAESQHISVPILAFAGQTGEVTFRLSGPVDDASTVRLDNLSVTVRLDLLGDMDFNGEIDMDDIDDFVLGLRNPAAYEALYRAPPSVRGDTDQDGDQDFDDIAGFVSILNGGSSSQVTSLATERIGDISVRFLRLNDPSRYVATNGAFGKRENDLGHYRHSAFDDPDGFRARFGGTGQSARAVSIDLHAAFKLTSAASDGVSMVVDEPGPGARARWRQTKAAEDDVNLNALAVQAASTEAWNLLADRAFEQEEAWVNPLF